jgi:hypothetical protein
MLACASSRSVAVEHIAPVVKIAAILCTLAICDTTPLAPLPLDLPRPFEIRSVHQMSAAYSILGMTDDYSFVQLPHLSTFNPLRHSDHPLLESEFIVNDNT